MSGAGREARDQQRATFLIWQVPGEKPVTIKMIDAETKEHVETLEVHRDHDSHSISATFTYDGGHFFIGGRLHGMHGARALLRGARP